MQVYSDINDLYLKRSTAVTVGTFDGVHLGHKYTFECLKNYADQNDLESVIVTFSDHPREVLQNKHVRLLTTSEEKIKAIKKFKVNHLLIMPFTQELASMHYKQFTDDYLIQHLHMRQLVFGYDHAFGKNREGSFENLSNYAKERDFQVAKVESVQLDNITIGSRIIRDSIESGDLDKANRLLGRPYSFSGIVIKGDQRGKQMGFPTANLSLVNDHKLVPKPAVYFVKVDIDDLHYHGMMNIGTNPTFNGQHQKIEVNIFAFNQEIYDQKITINVLKKIRDEKKFDSAELLIKQLFKDKDDCLKLFRGAE